MLVGDHQRSIYNTVQIPTPNTLVRERKPSKDSVLVFLKATVKEMERAGLKIGCFFKSIIRML